MSDDTLRHVIQWSMKDIDDAGGVRMLDDIPLCHRYPSGGSG
jgi:hypothetical protein